mmetsp:Transcript_1322/g.1857  ORF Transcript_1322/g.1857 Transcript_1322/m.1857 type:complete len:155 (+) Transcript_1322:76-540(+)
MISKLILATCILASLLFCNCFVVHSPLQRTTSAVKPLQMGMDDDLDPDVGYGPMGSLARQGLVPFLIRVVNGNTYDAAVKKYMLRSGCDKITAQANMDAYFNDPNGWAANKAKGIEIDYVNQNVKKEELALTFVWAIGIIGLAARIFVVQVLEQ